MYYCDQWRRPANPGGDAEDSRTSAVPSSPLHTRNTSPAVMNPVLTPKKKLAKEVVHKLKVNRCVISRSSHIYSAVFQKAFLFLLHVYALSNLYWKCGMGEYG